VRTRVWLALMLGCGAPGPDGAGETGGPIAGTSASGDMSSGSGGEPGSVCGPQAEQPAMTLLLDNEDALSLGRTNIDQWCRLGNIGGYNLGLWCENGTEEPDYRPLFIDVRPGVVGTVLHLDQQVRLRAHALGGPDGTFFVALHDTAGELLMAYASADALPGPATDADDPDDRYPPADFFAPLQLSAAWPCPADCAPTDGLFVVDTCCRQRGAVDVTYEGATTRAYDRGRGELLGPGRLDVRVPLFARESCDGEGGPATLTVFVWRVE
jgi:hypothetical protein